MNTKNIFFVIIGLIYINYSCNKTKLSDEGTLPVINLTIDDKYLWSIDSGLYIETNYREKWEFPAEIQYFENNVQIFRDKVGFRIKGNASRGSSMKSFGIYWKKKYGPSNFNYKMFPDIPVNQYKRLFLRNSGNDFGETHIKDGSITMIFKDFANVDYQSYKPSVLYLNNSYWGIYNIREMLTRHYFESHYNVNGDAVDLLYGSELHPRADDGMVDDFVQDVIKFINENDLSITANFDILKSRIDVDSYMDYVIINTYIANTDWPIGNSKWWRDKTSISNTKWRWIVYDTDWSLKGEGNIEKVWIGELFSNHERKDREDGLYLFNKMIKNKEFIDEFLDRYLFFINTVFEDKRVENIINNNKNRIKTEYDNHQKKWNTLSMYQWGNDIDEMIEFNRKRNVVMKKIITKLKE